MLRRLLAAIQGRKWWWDPLWDFLAVSEDGALGLKWGESPESVASTCKRRGWNEVESYNGYRRYQVELEDG